jgi:hypothetical protein
MDKTEYKKTLLYDFPPWKPRPLNRSSKYMNLYNSIKKKQEFKKKKPILITKKCKLFKRTPLYLKRAKPFKQYESIFNYPRNWQWKTYNITWM